MSSDQDITMTKEERKTEKLNLWIELALKNDLLALARAEGISCSEATREAIRRMIVENINLVNASERKM